MANRIIAGIDIGSTKVAAAIALIEDERSPRIIGEASYPSQGIKKGEIIGIEDAISSIASALSGAERMAGITVSSVYVSINGKHIISNNNKGVVAVSDEISREDMLRAMEQARTVGLPPAREIIHLLQREFIVDSVSGIQDPEGMRGNRLEVDAHIISSTATAVHNLNKCIQTLGLRIDSEVFTGWAASMSVLTSTEKELGVLLLDIGGGTTSITSFEEGAVTFSTSLALGGSNVTRDLAAGLRLSIDDAEKVKLNIDKLAKNTSKDKKDDKEEGSKKDIVDITDLEIEGQKTISRKQFDGIVNARVEEIFEIVVQHMNQAGYTHKLPSGVVITGGSAGLPGITSIAKKVFGVPARVGYPRGLDGLIDDISSPTYAVLQGLILHGLADEGLSVSRGKQASVIKSGAGIANKLSGFLRNLLP